MVSLAMTTNSTGPREERGDLASHTQKHRSARVRRRWWQQHVESETDLCSDSFEVLLVLKVQRTCEPKAGEKATEVSFHARELQPSVSPASSSLSLSLAHDPPSCSRSADVRLFEYPKHSIDNLSHVCPKPCRVGQKGRRHQSGSVWRRPPFPRGHSACPGRGEEEAGQRWGSSDSPRSQASLRGRHRRGKGEIVSEPAELEGLGESDSRSSHFWGHAIRRKGGGAQNWRRAKRELEQDQEGALEGRCMCWQARALSLSGRTLRLALQMMQPEKVTSLTFPSFLVV